MYLHYQSIMLPTTVPQYSSDICWDHFQPNPGLGWRAKSSQLSRRLSGDFEFSGRKLFQRGCYGEDIEAKSYTWMEIATYATINISLTHEKVVRKYTLALIWFVASVPQLPRLSNWIPIPVSGMGRMHQQSYYVIAISHHSIAYPPLFK